MLIYEMYRESGVPLEASKNFLETLEKVLCTPLARNTTPDLILTVPIPTINAERAPEWERMTLVNYWIPAVNDSSLIPLDPLMGDFRLIGGHEGSPQHFDVKMSLNGYC